MELRAQHFSGVYFDGLTSQAFKARLKLAENHAEIWVEDRLLRLQSLTGARVFPSVGQVPSRIQFHDGGSFETPERIYPLKPTVSGRISYFIYQLEQRWRMVAVATVALIACAVLFFQVVVPHFASQIAHALPPQAVNLVEAQTEAVLRKVFFPKTEFSKADQKTLRKINRVFAAVQKEFPHLNLRLDHVRAPDVGPNAFALPGGHIFMTEEFTRLVTKPDQVRAVLYHEVAHVFYRHGIERMVRDSALALAVSVALGDVGGVGLLIALASSQNSREMEAQADQFAAERMRAAGKDPAALGEALRVMEKHSKFSEPKGDSLEGKVFKLFSSHPRTSDRIERVKKK